METEKVSYIRTARTLALVFWSLSLITSLDLFFHRSADGEVFGRWSMPLFALLILVSGIVLVGIPFLIWLWRGQPYSLLDSLVQHTRHPVAYWIGLGISVAGLLVLWYLDLPLWRNLRYELTFLLLLPFGTLIALSQRKERIWPLSTLLLVSGAFAALHLAANVYLGNASFDEAAFAYTGYQAALGKIGLYQPGTYWAKEMPLLYYLPGLIQAWFGPGIYLPRITFAVMAALGLIMVYLVGRREAGPWAGFAALLILALSVPTMQSYGIAFGHGGVMAFLVGGLWVMGLKRWPGWLRIGVALGLTSFSFLVRNTMILAPIILGIYFILTEKPRDWLPGIVLAFLMFSGIFMLFWPEILSILRWVPMVSRLFSLTLGPTHELTLLTEPDNIATATYSITQIWLPLLRMSYAHFLLLGLLIITVGLVIHVWRPRPVAQLWRLLSKEPFILLLTAQLVIGLAAQVIFLYASNGLAVCDNCMTRYFNYFSVYAALLIGIVLARSWPHIRGAWLKRQHFLSWMFIVTALMGFSPWALTRIKLSYPTDLDQAQQTSREMAEFLTPQDRILYLSSLWFILPLPDLQVEPMSVMYMWNYLGSEEPIDTNYLRSRNLWDYEAARVVLESDATAVVIDEGALQWAEKKNEGELRDLIEGTLSEQYSLVTTLKYKRQSIWIYRRVEEP